MTPGAADRNVALALLLVATSASAAAQTSSERAERVRLLKERAWDIQAVRVRGELEIDGRLDDEAWDDVQPVTEFFQRETFEGLPATEPTHAYVLYDDENLYMGFRCFDSDPERPLARAMFRDENIAADDSVAILIDAYNDHRSAIQLATNANGMLFDMSQNGEESSTRNVNWDGVWYARGSQTDFGWEAEVVVPFESLRFDPPPSGDTATFGIGFKRNLPRKNEETYWPFVGNDSTWYRPAELGHLNGLAGIRSGRAIEVRPYALTSASEEAGVDGRATRNEIGLDAKWGVTTGLTADFTVNTDFAQEEVDVQQVNLTRFSLFFPEKRQIFLESQRSFLFGVPREADLVFTRRIGLSRTGGIIPILGGARLSGRQGPYSVGIMSMQTDDVADFGLPSENMSVVRLQRDVFSRSSVGMLFTNRQGGGAFNRVYGADLNLYLGQRWSIESYLALSEDDDRPSLASSAYAKLEYRSDRYGAIYRYLGIDEDFAPGIGFVRRPDAKQNRGVLRFSPRPSIPLIRQLHFTGTVDYIPNQRNVLETRLFTGEFETVFESGHSAAIAYTDNYEFLEEAFRLRPDVTIDPGAYDFSNIELRFSTFGRAHRRLSFSYITGGFWDGDRDTFSVSGAYRIDKHLGLAGSYEFNRIHLPSGSFTTHLASARVEIAFRTDVILMSLFQYNDDTRELSSNIRFNWIPKPGSDFFIVYNELDEVFRGLGLKNRSLSVKFNYLFAL